MSNTKILGKNAEYTYKEGEVASGATVYPGMVVEETGTITDGAGEPTPLVQPVSSVEKIGENFRVALTPRSPPHANDADVPIEHEYDAGEHVQYATVYAGRVQNAILADGGVLASSSDANVSYDDALGTNDDGTLQITTAGGSVLCRAREGVDNSTGGGGAGGVDGARIDVEVTA
ncbi:capsid stabilizing protein [Haloarcula tailed virus 3]|uniref:Capsid stabilizing protein n=1 Tax=Haloarcula tailed virus 3 TaxID=2877990 RepID=A0AAE9BZK6_9CAUD|nr:capsid stabilizing protein [Haloarcula tailed virus 3]UBF23366.1 capsid stabilizing protein [Haloarcula tailed virus 3]